MTETREILMRTPGATPNEQALVPLAGVKDFYARDADPGAVGAGSVWKDTTNNVFWQRNADNDGWEPVFRPRVEGQADAEANVQATAIAAGFGAAYAGGDASAVDGSANATHAATSVSGDALAGPTAISESGDANANTTATSTDGQATAQPVATATGVGDAWVNATATATDGMATAGSMAVRGAESVGMSAVADAVSGRMAFNGTTPIPIPELPATPTAQDIADVLVALGLVTQAP